MGCRVYLWVGKCGIIECCSFFSLLKTWLVIIIGTFDEVWEVGGMDVSFVFLSFVMQTDTAVTRNATMNEGCDL